MTILAGLSVQAWQGISYHPMWRDSNYERTLVAIKHLSVDASALSKRLNTCSTLSLSGPTTDRGIERRHD